MNDVNDITDNLSTQSPMSPTGDTIADFIDAMKAAGVHMDLGSPKGPHPIADGRLHRANALGKKNMKNMHVFYVLHADGVAAGAFGDYQLGIEDTWCAKKPSTMTKEEKTDLRDRMAKAAKERAEAQAALHIAAATAAKLIMSKTGKATPDHAYLRRRGCPSIRACAS